MKRFVAFFLLACTLCLTFWQAAAGRLRLPPPFTARGQGGLGAALPSRGAAITSDLWARPVRSAFLS